MKFRPQTSLTEAAARPRLVEQCLHGAPCSAQLSLLAAPAGFGKTTLLGEISRWLENEGCRTVWLNCDEGDRDLAVFLRSIAEAFEQANLGLRSFLREAEQLPDLLAELPYSIGIFVDQYEAAAHPLLDDALEAFARLLPINVSMFVAARAISPERFIGLELDGFVRLVTANDLRFSDAEAIVFLDSHVPANVIRELVAQSDGWAFVLQLIRLSARSRADGGWDQRAASSSRVRIADFLASEVMSGLDDALRNFAMETSLLKTVTVDDAEAITGRPDCAALIARLQPLVPIVALENYPITAHFHPLFQEYLLGALQLRPRPEIVRLHERLARHYANTRRVLEAVECALGAGLNELAGAIVEAAGAVRYVTAEGISQARQLYQLLPESLVHSRLRLRLLGIVSLAHHAQSSRAAPEFAKLEADVAGGRFAAQMDEEARIDLEVTRSIVAFSSVEHSLYRPDWSALRADTLRIRASSPGDQRLWVVPIATEIQLLLRQGRALDAAPLIDDYVQLTQHVNGVRGALDAAVYQAALNLARGELDVAAKTAGKVVATCLQLDGHEDSHQGMLAHSLLGQIEYLRNNLRGAVAHFDKLNRPRVALSFLIYSANYTWRAVCDVAGGRLHDAFERLDSALALARNRQLQHLALLATAIRCDLEANHGDVGGVSRPEVLEQLSDSWREHSSDSSLPWITLVWLARSLVTTFLGKARSADAIAVARKLVEVCAGSDQRLISASAWILLGRSLLAGDHDVEGRQAIARALALTDTTGATRLFLDYGREVVDVVREFGNEGSASSREWARQIVARTSPLELLTPRQKAVLRELAKGGSTKEIARALSLSPETVKCHLKVIFDRLGTSNREGAARAAREAQLTV
ncbi:MAG TPA: LuxR C-terminal-related transcriptional regulator [Steroidobacteraceae bacterium]|nr:LuxR C-terminal-related transcriptional regulator [Steroidobacteraceae bacterium]